jgi:hypothetical protein
MGGNSEGNCYSQTYANSHITNSSCAVAGTTYSASANIVSGVTVDSTTFKGDVGSSTAYGSVDWTQFLNTLSLPYGFLQAFGYYSGSGSFTSSSYFGRCTTGNCKKIDYSLDDGNTTLRNTTVNGSSQNTALTDGTTCDTTVAGEWLASYGTAYSSTNLTLTKAYNDASSAATLCTSGTCYIHYLKNAIEIIGMGGNDNGLCEQDETCLYTPNFGAYQGSFTGTGGTVMSKCNYPASQHLTGITMFFYPTNGE